MGFSLVTTAWVSTSEERMQDLMNALEVNLRNSFIEKIHVVVQHPSETFMEALTKGETRATKALSEAITDPKVKLVHHGERATFSKLFSEAADHADGRISLIASGDVSFDKSLGLLQTFDLEETLLCLSANNGKGNFPAHVAQCAWAFKKIPKLKLDWHPGVLGSDNKVAHEAAKAGLCVVNPCVAIKVVQRYRPNDPDWPSEPRLVGPYLEVYPIDVHSMRKIR